MEDKKIAGIINPKMERKAKEFEDNWELVNMVDYICREFASEHEKIYTEDVCVALERVKLHWIGEHAEARIEHRLEKAGIKLPEYED